MVLTTHDCGSETSIELPPDKGYKDMCTVVRLSV